LRLSFASSYFDSEREQIFFTSAKHDSKKHCKILGANVGARRATCLEKVVLSK
jgi:hypothetical protein